MKTNQEYKNAALAALKGNWAPAVVTSIVLMAVIYLFSGPYIYVGLVGLEQLMVSSPKFVWVALGLFYFGFIFMYMPMFVGYANATRDLYNDGDGRLLSNTVSGTFRLYFRNVWGMFLSGLYIFLWTLLLIVPGVIKSFAYAMTPYILNDYPELSANQAINLSRKMMKGHKFDLFCLLLSFIGWSILSIFTIGIGTLWLYPYMYTSMAAFYQDVKKEYSQA
jgi:uncharacterized membrane protein